MAGIASRAYGDLIRDLITFRKANSALENGKWGAVMQKVETDSPEQVFAWVRQEEGNKVLGLFNFSAEPQSITFADGLPAGESYHLRSPNRPRTVLPPGFRSGDTFMAITCLPPGSNEYSVPDVSGSWIISP